MMPFESYPDARGKSVPDGHLSIDINEIMEEGPAIVEPPAGHVTEGPAHEQMEMNDALQLTLNGMFPETRQVDKDVQELHQSDSIPESIREDSEGGEQLQEQEMQHVEPVRDHDPIAHVEGNAYHIQDPPRDEQADSVDLGQILQHVQVPEQNVIDNMPSENPYNGPNEHIVNAQVEVHLVHDNDRLQNKMLNRKDFQAGVQDAHIHENEVLPHIVSTDDVQSHEAIPVHNDEAEQNARIPQDAAPEEPDVNILKGVAQAPNAIQIEEAPKQGDSQDVEEPRNKIHEEVPIPNEEVPHLERTHGNGLVQDVIVQQGSSEDAKKDENEDPSEKNHEQDQTKSIAHDSKQDPPANDTLDTVYSGQVHVRKPVDVENILNKEAAELERMIYEKVASLREAGFEVDPESCKMTASGMECHLVQDNSDSVTGSFINYELFTLALIVLQFTVVISTLVGLIFASRRMMRKTKAACE